MCGSVKGLGAENKVISDINRLQVGKLKRLNVQTF
jgi:hypothetical protein